MSTSAYDLQAAQEEQQTLRHDIGVISFGVSLIIAGVFATLAMLNIFIPQIVANLLLPGYCIILGLEFLTTYSLFARRQDIRLHARTGLIFLAITVIVVLFVVMNLYAANWHSWVLWP